MGEGLNVSDVAPPLAPLALIDHRGGMRSVAGPAPAPRLLVFVPMAFTPVCADEIGTLAELAADRSRGPEVLVVSTDTSATLRAWLGGLDPHGHLTGCSDFWPHGQAARAYGAFDERAGTALRRSYSVRTDGSWQQVASAAHGMPRARADHEKALDSLLEGL